MFAAYFELRRPEVVGLKWSAIYFERKTLMINHKIVPVNDNGTYTLYASNTLKNNTSYRTMPLDDSFYNYLVDLKAKQEENKKLYGKSYSKTYKDYVCVNDVGNLITPNYITKAFKRILEKNEMRVIRFHDLRHSSASLLLSLGYPMKNIQMWLGHSSFNTTANIYAHIDASAKIEMVSGIAQELSN
jgi:integrase